MTQTRDPAVQAMLDKQNIHELLVRYCRAIDQGERRDGTWRIARRRVTFEWNHDMPMTQTWLQGNLPGPSLIRGAKKPNDLLHQAGWAPPRRRLRVRRAARAPQPRPLTTRCSRRIEGSHCFPPGQVPGSATCTAAWGVCSRVGFLVQGSWRR